MSSLKEQKHNKKETKVLNQVLENELSKFGNYTIKENGEVVCTIDKDKIEKILKNKEIYKLALPSKLFLLLKVQSLYRDFSKEKIKDVIYVFCDINFDKPVQIDSFSNIIIDNCKFMGLTINSAKNVTFNAKNYEENMIVCNHNLYIEAQKLKIAGINLVYFANKSKESTIKFNVKNLSMNATSIVSFGELNIKAEEVKICSSDLSLKKIKIMSNKIYEEKNRFRAKNEIIIENKNNDEIKNLNAPKIKINGKDITPLSNARQQLIKKLKNLRDKRVNEIDGSVELYREDLEKRPLSKKIN